MKDFILLVLSNLLILIAVMYKRSQQKFTWVDKTVIFFLLFIGLLIARIVGWH